MANSERTREQLRHHYLVERELASRLRNSDRSERAELFKILYQELFERVPDHPRLTRRDTEEDSRRNIEVQMRLLSPHLHPDSVLLEFAPGDCRLGFAAARECREVIGVDISDQRAEDEGGPDNFALVIYDGYHLALEEESVDVAFSYQFLEHLHPDDVELHFQMVRRVLKPGGVYVFDTPHRFSGPHDISRYFGDGLDCFHFQEWTYRDMRRLLARMGFPVAHVHRRGRMKRSRLFNLANDTAELLLSSLPASIRFRLSGRLFPAVTLSAFKEPRG